MTESNGREPMTFTCQQLAAWWCGPGKCPMWCGLGRCQPVFARAAAPQAQPFREILDEQAKRTVYKPGKPPQAQPSEQQAAKRRISVHGPGTWMSHPEVPQAQPSEPAYAPGLRAAFADPQAQPAPAEPSSEQFYAIRDARNASYFEHRPEPTRQASRAFDGGFDAGWDERATIARLARPEPAPISDSRIIEIRDSLLPSQGESFDCIAFARVVLAERMAPK